MAVFDLEMIKEVYAKLPKRVAAARKMLGRPLTLSEKYYILTYGTHYLKVLLQEEKIM